ncbi:MAG: FkbM family methyltransferase [Bacteroidetes bacterium]|nr:FkbM family methyltransferase [Bacteroidota bacterium]
MLEVKKTNKKIKKLLVPVICKKNFQSLWEKLYLFAVTGMNYGSANMIGVRSTGELKVIELIEKKIQQECDIILFDVGANEGGYTQLLASDFKHNNKKIFAFEPSQVSFGNLRQHTLDLPFVQLYNFGFSDKEEAAQIFANYKGSGAATIYKEGFYNYRSNENFTENISLKTIDGFCCEQGVTKIDFLKIDVEGHEWYVLKGAQQMMQSKRIRFIQFEFGSFHVFSRTFFKDFWDMLSPTYSVYRIVCDGIVEIKSYSENLEIFRTANFLAELKQ